MRVDLQRSAVVQVVLEGVALPATKTELLDYARTHDRDAARTLESLPDRELLGIVRLSLPLTEIEAQHRAMRAVLIGAVGIAFLLSLIMSYLVARSITRPLAEIVQAAKRMVGGEFHPRIRTRSGDEVSELAQVLNHMAASIEEKIEALKQDRAKMAATLIAMQEGVMVLAVDGTVRLINPAMERMIGRQGAELTGKSYWEVIRQPRLHEFIAHALAGGTGATTEITTARVMRPTAGSSSSRARAMRPLRPPRSPRARPATRHTTA